MLMIGSIGDLVKNYRLQKEEGPRPAALDCCCLLSANNYQHSKREIKRKAALDSILLSAGNLHQKANQTNPQMRKEA